ncbi:hypothetical protein DPMN_192924 [Dreissena polymorpha]|uniref:Uncharacterized protein n=1 Tax=Dreissena polymorpha TaxID=45954 RepID=A0A9D3Y2X3_DREPO|nr:hypothetical protein DPMN_192924 [Dreissena polymorpha]
MITLTLTTAYVHLLCVSVLCNQIGAVFERSLERGNVDSVSRRKRAVTGDSGYGSRLDAGNTVASDSLQRNLFARFGKRAMDESERRFIAEYGFGSRLPEVMVKRVPVDFGYGSRSRMADNLAKNRDVLFGGYGPGKRAMDIIHGDGEIFGRNIRGSEPGIEVDSGYASRVSAGNQIADDYATRAIYGVGGPGI